MNPIGNKKKTMNNTTTSQEGVTAEWTQTNKRMCESLLSVVPDFQRNKKRTTKAKINHDLHNGNFYQNGATIVLSDEGLLIDGQHRLSSFLETGVFPEVLIVKGISTVNGYATIDSGSSRTCADTFKSKGVKNYAPVSTVAVGLLRLNNGDYHSTNAGYSNKEVYQCYLENSESIDYWIKKYTTLNSNIARTTRSLVACYAEKIISRDKIKEFFSAVESGIGSRTCISFRKALIVNSNKARGKMHSREIAALCLYSLDKFDQGIELSSIKMPNKFPYLSEG